MKEIECNLVKESKNLKCGLIMPISAMGLYTEKHWKDIKDILTEALKDTDFDVEIVSNGSEVGIIQERIIHNIYENDVIICDVSGKNPNVMFELGMRLAFDKPTIIIKDELTDYSFDTSSIEHILYPSDLNYHKIVEFKETLKVKVVNTDKKAKEDVNYTTFLGHFGKFKVGKLSETEVTSEQYILREIEELKKYVYMLGRETNFNRDILRHDRTTKMIFKHAMSRVLREYIEKAKMEDELPNGEKIMGYVLSHPLIRGQKCLEELSQIEIMNLIKECFVELNEDESELA